MEAAKLIESAKEELQKQVVNLKSQTEALKKELQYKSVNPPLDANKAISKMMALLMKAKKLHQMKDQELSDLKKQLLKNLSEP